MASTDGRTRLQKLYEHHRRIADGLKLALDALDGDLVARKTASNGTLATALDLDEQRRAAKPHGGSRRGGSRRGAGRPARTKPAFSVADKTRQRKRTAALLAKLSTDEPRTVHAARGVAVLIKHDYVRSAGRDERGRPLYLRTEKAFDVTP